MPKFEQEPPMPEGEKSSEEKEKVPPGYVSLEDIEKDKITKKIELPVEDMEEIKKLLIEIMGSLFREENCEMYEKSETEVEITNYPAGRPKRPLEGDFTRYSAKKINGKWHIKKGIQGIH
jgi:hypothetical protein